ncbi:MAG: GxxExxY protein [Planctomycetes bacterium]|nr:GxxExxY protein [Planctomycetota bacterium]
MTYLHEELTEKIIGTAMEVHKTLHDGFLESVYEAAMAIELDLQKISFERQKPIDVFYKSRLAKQFFFDFVIEGKVIVELKAIKKLSETENAQVLNYLKATGQPLALLINFGAPSLEFKRIINTR